MKVVVSHWMHGNPEFDLIKFKIPYEEHQRSIIIKIRDIEFRLYLMGDKL